MRPGGEVAGMALGPREWNGPDMKALLDTLLPGAAGRAAAPTEEDSPRAARRHLPAPPQLDIARASAGRSIVDAHAGPRRPGER
jgi:hypothetical protein